MKNLVDDVSTLAVEECLIQRLPSLLSTEAICDLTDAELQRIAGENDRAAAERAQTTEKLEILRSGLTELKRLKKYNPSTSNFQVCILARIFPLNFEADSILQQYVPAGTNSAVPDKQIEEEFGA